MAHQMEKAGLFERGTGIKAVCVVCVCDVEVRIVTNITSSIVFPYCESTPRPYSKRVLPSALAGHDGMDPEYQKEAPTYTPPTIEVFPFSSRFLHSQSKKRPLRQVEIVSG